MQLTLHDLQLEREVLRHDASVNRVTVTQSRFSAPTVERIRQIEESSGGVHSTQ